MGEQEYNKRYIKLMHKFVISILIVLVFFIFKQIFVQYQINQEKGVSEIVNIAGRQRMLSQKIVKDLLMMQDNNNFDITPYKQDLKDSLELLQQTNDELLNKNKSAVFLQNDKNEISQMFQNLNPSYVSIVDNTKLIIDNYNKVIPDKQQIHNSLNEILNIESTFLSDMNSIVSQYEYQAEKSVAFTQKINGLMVILIIVALVFVIFRIYLPLQRFLKLSYVDENKKNKKLMTIFNIMKEMIFVIKNDGEILFMNENAKKICCQSEGDVNTVYSIENIKWMDIDVLKVINKNKEKKSSTDKAELFLESIDGSIRTYEMNTVEINWDYQPAVLLNLYDITAENKVKEELKNLAIKDKLTGLYNRTFLENIIEKEFKRAERYEIPISAAILDLDHFKRVNDEWGHPVGDSVLQFTAKIIKNCIRMSDYAVRIGGEEFLVLMPGTNSNGAVILAERIRKEIEKAKHQIIGNFTASIGVAERNQCEEYHIFYGRIDKALYEAKKRGRNCVIKAQQSAYGNKTISLRWSSKWNCGEETIDKQHLELFNIASCFELNDNLEITREQYVDFISNIIDYLTVHFEYEENQLFKIGYKDLNNHKKIHVNMLQKAKEMLEKIEENNYSVMALNFILDEVILGHILTEDIKFFPYFRNNNN